MTQQNANNANEDDRISWYDTTPLERATLRAVMRVLRSGYEPEILALTTTIGAFDRRVFGHRRKDATGIGKPDSGNPHVRFDERGWETGRRKGVSARAPDQ